LQLPPSSSSVAKLLADVTARQAGGTSLYGQIWASSAALRYPAANHGSGACPYPGKIPQKGHFDVPQSGRVLLYAAEDALHVVRQRLEGIYKAAGVALRACLVRHYQLCLRLQ
jgi:hypothetical protein